MEIRKYKEEIDYSNILSLLKSEEHWNRFLKKAILMRYKKSLINTISYVAYVDTKLVGYSRSLEDIESYIYVCELLINTKYRGNNIGKMLLDRIVLDFPDHEIFVMSDKDDYYKKLGYKIEGSIFKASGL